MRAVLVLGIFLLVLVAGSVADTQTAFVDPAIDDALDDNEQVRVLVVLKEDDDATKQEIQDVQEEVIEDLMQEADVGIAEEGTQGVIEHQLTNAPIIAAQLDAAAIDELASNPDVEAVYLSKTYSIGLTTSVPAISADDVWGNIFNGTNITGAGQTICVIDTGITPSHAAFTGKIVAQKCYCRVNNVSCCQGLNESTDATDDHGHGTHVAGIALGGGPNVTGVAKGANVLPVKVCNSAGNCESVDLALAVDYCINQSATYNISVISMSISDGATYATQGACPTDFDALFDEAVSNNIIITVASGNEFSTTGIGHPSCEANATSVGATTRDGLGVTSYGNRGPLLDVMAPGGTSGDQIISAATNGDVTGNQGTSMATPHVAGVAALLAQNAKLRNKTFNPIEIEQILEETAVGVSGFRRADALAALLRQSINYTYNGTNNSLANPGVGVIFFRNASLNVSFFDCFNISLNNITLRDTNANCTQFNQTSTVRLQALSFHDARPLLNGAPCSALECQNRTYNNGALTFDVIHFSSYTAGSAVNLSISDTTDTESRFINEQVIFSANFTNNTGPVNTSIGACIIAINATGSYGAIANMSFNTSRAQYELNQSFSDDGNGTYNITCTSFNETLSLIDHFQIHNDTLPPTINLQSPANGSSTSNSNVTFTYQVRDNSSIQNCSIFVSGNYTANSTSVLRDVDQTFSFLLDPGAYSWNITCIDALNYTNASATFAFTRTQMGISNDNGNSGGGGGGGGGSSCVNLCTPIGLMSCAGYSEIRCGDFNGDGCTESKSIACNKGDWCQLPIGCTPMPCTEEWFCDEWTPCENGTRTRKCIEGNACGTEELKPEMTVACAYAIAENPDTPPIQVVDMTPPMPWYRSLPVRIATAAALLVSFTGYLILRFKHKPRKH